MGSLRQTIRGKLQLFSGIETINGRWNAFPVHTQGEMALRVCVISFYLNIHSYGYYHLIWKLSSSSAPAINSLRVQKTVDSVRIACETSSWTNWFITFYNPKRLVSWLWLYLYIEAKDMENENERLASLFQRNLFVFCFMHRTAYRIIRNNLKGMFRKIDGSNWTVVSVLRSGMGKTWAIRHEKHIFFWGCWDVINRILSFTRMYNKY